MSRLNRSISYSQGSNYPTRSDFETLANEETRRSSKEESSFIKNKRPVLPEYLREMPLNLNPFTVVKTKRSLELKKLERERKEFNLQKIKKFPIEKTVNRYVRMKFNASYELKKFQFSLNILDNIDSGDKREERNIRKQFPKIDKTSNQDLIAEKRQICLLDCAIEMTKKNIENLDKTVEKKAKSLEKKSKYIEFKKHEFDCEMKTICQKAYEVSQITDKQMGRRKDVLLKVNRAKYVLSRLNVECIQLEEEYLQLKMYRDFLQKCDEMIRSKQTIEKAGLMNQLKMNAITIEKELQLALVNSYSQSTITHEELDEIIGKFNQNYSEVEAENTSNAENGNENSVVKLNCNNFECLLQSNQEIFTPEQLLNLKEMVFNGFNINNIDEQNKMVHILNSRLSSNSQADENQGNLNEDFNEDSFEESHLDEDSIFYKDPLELVNIFSELEEKNMSLIENVQQQDEMCDHMRKKMGKIKTDLIKQVVEIDEKINEGSKIINEIKESILWVKNNQSFLDSFTNTDRYKEMFYLDNLNQLTMDELIDYMTEKITELYNYIFEDYSGEKRNIVYMLKEIEILIDSRYIQLQMCDKMKIQQAKKLIDKRRRRAIQKQLQQVLKETREKMSKMTLKKFHQPPKYRYGRKVVYRSVPPSQIANVSKTNTEKNRQEEENAYFFT